MTTETITLNEERSVTLTTFLWDNSTEFQDGVKRPLVIVCPGGGYSYLSDREGDPVALAFLSAGFHAAVLKYGICEYAPAPGPLKDAAQAISYVREHAKEWGVREDQVYIGGFSAGGHVAAQLGVFWKNKELLPEYADDPERIRPNGLILGYPVIDLRATSRKLDIGIEKGADLEAMEHHPKMPAEKNFVFDEETGRYFVNFENAMNAYIFDGEFTDEQEDFYSLQKQVSVDTPETFLWHCAGDGLIFPSNSVDFASALLKAGVDCELHIYSGGEHGLARADYVTANSYGQYYPHAKGWLPLAIKWLNRKTGFDKKIVEDYGKE